MTSDDMEYEYVVFLQFHGQDNIEEFQIDEDQVEKQSEFIAYFMRDTSRPFWKHASIRRRLVGQWEEVYEPGAHS